jgi:hypothetical protein
VAAGNDAPVTLTFDTTGLALGVYTTTLEVSSNDPDDPLVLVAITLTVDDEPDIAVSDPFIEMTLVSGESGDAWLGIANEGGAPLEFSLAEGAAWLEVVPLTGTLVPQNNSPVTLTFDTTGLALGVYTTTLEVGSNDPDQPLIGVPVTLTVVDCQPITGLNFTWEPLSPTLGQVLTFTGQVSGGLPVTFTWDFGDGITATGQTASHLFAASGVYTVTLTATNSCDLAIISYTVTVNEPPAWRMYLPVISRNAGN